MSKLPTAPAKAARLLRAALDARFGARVRDVRVFGSYARGDWHAESDVDVLVVVDDLAENERHAVFDLAWEIYAQNLVHLSPLALSTNEWADHVARELRITRDIAVEGIPV